MLTRMAPTPSGYLHLGNILSFCITAALAEEHGANILLRIDDLDQGKLRVAEKINGEWKIMNHHSSAMPEPVDSSRL